VSPAVEPRVSLRGIVKTYPGVRALRAENGAGESTLMGGLGGSIRPVSGAIQLDGRQGCH
jgi:ABC-type sugar transport system ATPase subunit